MRALIIEDEILIGMGLKSQLSKFECRVENIVYSLGDALKANSGRNIDIIFADIDLGRNRATGIDLVKEIQKVSNPYIVYTSGSIEEYTDDCIATGPIAMLNKPIKSSELEKLFSQLKKY
jgi:two-component SAPR family response regulator